MAPKRTLVQSGILALALFLVALAAGCAPPKFQPEQFVGDWTARPPGTAYPFKLTLLGDGTGVISGPYEPHPNSIKWYLRRDKLIVASQGGGKPDEYDVRFDGPDSLVLIVGENELATTRVKTE